jgi:hypothetical protein
MATENVNQCASEHCCKRVSRGTLPTTIESLRSGLTEVDQCCQEAQANAEALLSGIRALIKLKDDQTGVNLDNAAKLCEQVDAIFYSLMNDINCIAERNDAAYDKDAKEVCHV